eukprot:g23.t2
MMILPVHLIFRNTFVHATQQLQWRPFFLAPQKKYNFKTPAPLPPPPTEFRPKARSRSRLTHTLWVVHGRKHPALAQCRNPSSCAMEQVRSVHQGRQAMVGAPGTVLQLPYEVAVSHIEAELCAALHAALATTGATGDHGGYALCGACEATEELLELCERVSAPDCRDDTWDAVMYHRIGLSWKTRRPELIWLDDKEM